MEGLQRVGAVDAIALDADRRHVFADSADVVHQLVDVGEHPVVQALVEELGLTVRALPARDEAVVDMTVAEWLHVDESAAQIEAPQGHLDLLTIRFAERFAVLLTHRLPSLASLLALLVVIRPLLLSMLGVRT